jgi:hypothetical protein
MGMEYSKALRLRLSAELRHRCVTFRGYAFSLQDEDQGSPQYPQVKPHTKVVNIPHIELEFLFPSYRISTVYLRPTGDSWLDIMTPALFGGVVRQILHQQRSGADQAHISSYDVYQFGKLIEAGLSQEAPKSGKTLLIRQQLALLVSLISHCAEFKQCEGLAVPAGPHLTKKYWWAEF